MLKFFLDKNNKNFIRLWCAQLISQFGDRVNQMALIGLVAERTPGSAWGLAKLIAFTIIPVFIIGPIAGAYVDRWDRRKTLFICDILRGLVVLSIAFIFIDGQSMLPIYAAVFLAFCFSRFYVPAKLSIVPDLVPQENLLMANSLMTTTGMIAFVAGCALGGFMVDWWGAKGGFIWDSMTFFISSILIMTISKDIHLSLTRREIIAEGREMIRLEKSILHEIKEGINYLVAHREIRFVIAMLFILLAGAGAIYVVMIIFVQQAFGSVTKDLGILAVFLGIGLFSGALLYGRFGKRFAWYNTVFSCLIFGGIMMNIFAFSVQYNPHLILAGFLAVTLGLVTGPIFIASNTIIHLVADENMRGKVFSALEFVIHLAFLIAMMTSSYLNKYFDAFWILVGVGIIFTMIGMIGFIKYRNPKKALRLME